jgi:flagellar FliJ protein
MKAETAQLELVLRLRREDERHAGEDLRAARERLAEEEERLLAVERYAEEYHGRELVGLRDPRVLRDQRAFLDQLRHTCQAQQRQVVLSRQVLESARARWITARMQREAIERLGEHRQAQRTVLNARIEQRQQDELALRVVSRMLMVSSLD